MDEVVINLLSNKIDKVDQKVDKLEEKMDALLKFKWQIMGGTVAASLMFGIILQIIYAVIGK